MKNERRTWEYLTAGTHLKPSLRLDVTESPTILVSTLNRLTISPAPRSANSGSCFNVDKYASFLWQPCHQFTHPSPQATSPSTHLTRAMILCPLNRINIARPAFAAAPTQNVSASAAAATGKDKPKKDSLVGDAKKSISLPMVRGTSMDTPDEMNSCAGCQVSGLAGDVVRGLTRPIAVVSCFFSGRAKSTSFLIELFVEVSPSLPGARANIRLKRLVSPTVGVNGSGLVVETSVFRVPVVV